MTSAFSYPGNDSGKFSQLLGLIADGTGNRVVVRPEQWERSKCYGPTRLSKLQHFLELALHKADGSIAFSYKDFCFGIQDNPFSNTRKECAQMICQHAKDVAARIRILFPDVKVDVNIKDDNVEEREWTCEKCGAKGKVSHERNADVLSVVYLIEDDHKRASPECDQPIRGIRIVNANVTG